MTTNNKSIKSNDQLTEKQQQWKDAIRTTIYKRSSVNLMIYDDGSLHDLEHHTKANILENRTRDDDECLWVENQLNRYNWDVGKAIMADYSSNFHAHQIHDALQSAYDGGATRFSLCSEVDLAEEKRKAVKDFNFHSEV